MKSLTVITTPDFFSDEGKVLTILFMEGMSCLHLRKPNSSQAALKLLIDEIPSEYHSRIVLHDQFELATSGSSYHFKGIHLNSRNNSIPAGFTGSISRSCHSLQEIQKGTIYDYQFLSPIFQSISKEGYGSGFPLYKLKQAAENGLINEKVIALGGISSSTIPLLQDIPFGGVAVLGALWGKAPSMKELNNITERFKQLKRCLTTHK